MNEEKKSDFITPRNAWKRLAAAQSYPQNLYIYGVTGYGKTTLLEQYFRGLECTWYSCRSGRLRQVELKQDGRRKRKTAVKDETGGILQTIVIDDLQFLKNAEDKETVLEHLRDKGSWVVLASRSPLPPWLKIIYMESGIMMISEKELAWSEREVALYFDKWDISLTKEQVEKIQTSSMGNPLGIRLIAKISADHGGFQEEFLQQSWYDFEDYLIEQLMEEWGRNLVEFLMHMSFLESFNVELAEMVTGDTAAFQRIKEAQEIGNFLAKDQNEIYTMRPLLRSALQKRARGAYGSDKIREIYHNAGLYYEVHDEIIQAFTMYERSGNKDRIREILIRNASRNPGNGHYFELRKYYLALSDREIEESPILMSGVSMLYSILLQPEESDRWYDKLKEYEERETGAARKEARARRIYLDIALPHRGIKGVLDVVRAVPLLMEQQRITLPEFSVTSNLPSVMNGGKDFCEWSRHDRTLAATMGKTISITLGRFGKGLVEIALGESLYEKGGDDYEVISLLNKGVMHAQAGGAIEMVYAAIGVQVRLNLIHGNEEAAHDILNGFAKNAEVEQEGKMQKSLGAQRCRLALYAGSSDVVEKWMEQAPDEEEEYCVLERYRYLTKIRCYLYLGEYYRALALLEKIRYFAEQYDRTYIQIETALLVAMAQYRTRQEGWRDTLLGAVKHAEDYGFFRVISEEGNAIWELLSEDTMKKMLQEACDEKYLKRLLEDTHSMALYYPLYLMRERGERKEIKGNALEILRLQAEGLTNEQIASKLNLKEETVRYHNKQNYKKLGVEGRAEAVITARKLRIL